MPFITTKRYTRNSVFLTAYRPLREIFIVHFMKKQKNIDCEKFHSEKLLHANLFTVVKAVAWLRLTDLTSNPWAQEFI